jgi:hypothetical protein
VKINVSNQQMAKNTFFDFSILNFSAKWSYHNGFHLFDVLNNGIQGLFRDILG